MIVPKVAIRGFNVLPLSVCAICTLWGPEIRMILIAPRPGAVADATIVSERILSVEDQLFRWIW